MAYGNELAPVRVPGHEPGCDGHCGGACSAEMALAWARRARVRCCCRCLERITTPAGHEAVGGLVLCGRCVLPSERQAPVASESPESARERIPTAADGVPVTMADLVGGCLR